MMAEGIGIGIGIGIYSTVYLFKLCIEYDIL